MRTTWKKSLLLERKKTWAARVKGAIAGWFSRAKGKLETKDDVLVGQDSIPVLSRRVCFFECFWRKMAEMNGPSFQFDGRTVDANRWPDEKSIHGRGSMHQRNCAQAAMGPPFCMRKAFFRSTS